MRCKRMPTMPETRKTREISVAEANRWGMTLAIAFQLLCSSAASRTRAAMPGAI